MRKESIVHSIPAVIILMCNFSSIVHGQQYTEAANKTITANGRNGSHVSALYVLGDSSVDCGDNTLFYPLLHGRLSLYPCNGSDHTLLPQLIAEKIGMTSIRPFYSQNGSLEDVLGGLNFGSTQATIINQGSYSHQSLNQQLRQVSESMQLLQLQMNENTAIQYTKSSIFFLSFGKEDYIDLFLHNSSYQMFNQGARSFATILVNQMINAVKYLYDANARKIICFGILPLGCTPRIAWEFNHTSARDYSGDGCVDHVNDWVLEYNRLLDERISQLNEEFPDAQIVFCDVYSGMMEIIEKPRFYGFEDLKKACCGLGVNGAMVGCISMDMACNQGSTHIWWDLFNPTQAVNSILADSAWSGQPIPDLCRPSSFSTPISRTRPHFKSVTISASNSKPSSITGRKLRAAVVGGGPAGSSAAEALAAGGVETFLIERNPPSVPKPCGGAIPLCMLEEFDIPHHLIDRHVTQMRIFSPSNIAVDFGKTLKPNEFIAMLRREVLDSFLRSRAQSAGATVIPGLVTSLDLPTSPNAPYTLHYTTENNSSRRSLTVDVVIGADGANSRVAKSIDAGEYTCAIAFQERIILPDEKMAYYENLAEMYVGDDVSPDFYGWVFPKCDHVAVGTGTVRSKQNIKMYQRAIRERARSKINGGKVVKVEAHPIPEHPRPVRVRGRVALVGDAAGYVTKCSGEGIYFAAKSGRVCGNGIVKASEGGEKMINECDLKREYLKEWDAKYLSTFRFLDFLQRVFYGSNASREALVELCGDEYVQRMTFESYLYKKMARGRACDDAKLFMNSIGSMVRCKVLGTSMEGLIL